MRKAIYSISILAMMTVTLFSITSCGSDDKDEPKPAEEATVKEVVLTMTAAPTDDMLKYADLCVETTIGKGETKTQVIDASHLTFDITVAASDFPVSVKVEYKSSPKVGTNPEEKDVVYADRKFEIKKYQILTDGTKKEVDKSSTIIISDPIPMAGSKLFEFIRARLAVITSKTVTIDAKGAVSSTSN